MILPLASLRKVIVDEVTALLRRIRSIERKVSYRTFGFSSTWNIFLIQIYDLNYRAASGAIFFLEVTWAITLFVQLCVRYAYIKKNNFPYVTKYILFCYVGKKMLLSFNLYFCLFMYSFISFSLAN